MNPAVRFGVVGQDHLAEGQQHWAHAPQDAFGGPVFGFAALFEQIAKADQAAEDLIRGFQPDDGLSGTVAGGAAGTHGVHQHGACRLDRRPGGAPVDAGMGLPHRVGDPGRLDQVVEVTHQFR